MNWKFYSRLFPSKASGAGEESLPVSEERNSGGFPFPLFPSSNREVLALQRLVGNQVVLKMLTRSSVAPGLVSIDEDREIHPKRSFWNRFRRNVKREERG